MPTELGYTNRLQDVGSSKKPVDNGILDLLDAECTTEEDDLDDDDLDDDYDEELEFAYQCDFQKKQPNKACGKQSLLSNLLSSSIGVSSEQCNSISKTQPIILQKSLSMPSTSSTTSSADPISESLKRNLEWEHYQTSMKKCQKSQKKASNHDVWSDNFSKW